MSVVVHPLAPGVRILVPQPAAEVAQGAERGMAGHAAFRAARLVTTVASGAGLLSLLVCGWFVRYTSHAFQMADLLHRSGWIGGQVAWYLGWTGRFGANATWLAAAAAGPGLARVLPGLAMCLWGAVLWVALPRVAAQMGRELSGMARLLAVEVVLLGTLGLAPALWFDLYKLTGSITYITPLALGTAVLGIGLGAMSRGRLDLRTGLLLAVLSALAVGFSDTWAGIQPLLLGGFAVCAGFLAGPRRRAAMRALAVSAIASGVGLIVMLHAPGNTVRRSLYPAPPHLATALAWAARDAGGFLAGPVAHNLPLLAAVVVAFLVLGLTAAPARDAAPEPGLTLRRALIALLALGAVLVAAHLPAETMTSGPPPPRSELIPGYAVVLFVAFLAWGSGATLAARRRGIASPRRAAVLAIATATAAVAVAPATTMALVARSWQAMSTYAAAEDAQWRMAASAPPGSDLVVPAVSSGGIGPLSHESTQELQPSADYWVNQAFAEYFGLHSVRTGTTAATAAATGTH